MAGSGEEVLFGVIIGSSVFARGLCAAGCYPVCNAIGKWALSGARSLAVCPGREY